MVTGRQIRQARVLPGLRPDGLAPEVGCIITLGVRKTEDGDGSVLAEAVASAFRQTLERLSIEFTDEATPRVQLRKGGA